MRFVAGQDAAAESHREYVAGQGAAAESHREYVAGRGAVAESLCGRGCSPAEAVAAAAWKRLPLRGGTPRGAAAARRSLTAAAALAKICGSRCAGGR